MTVNYEEFDDIERKFSFVSSAKARAAMKALATQHGLGYLSNPGGGQFTCIDERYPLYRFNCQVSECDDIEDLDRLRSAITAALAKNL